MNEFLKQFEDAGIKVVEVDPNSADPFKGLVDRIVEEVKIINQDKSKD